MERKGMAVLKDVYSGEISDWKAWRLKKTTKKLY
jgi:hypothetical protein